MSSTETVATGLPVGINKGFRVVKLKKRPRVAGRKGHRGPRRVIVRDVIREVTGYAPYEKRVLEFLRNGLDKKALRLAKRKVRKNLAVSMTVFPAY